jgi:hypothetical protein
VGPLRPRARGFVEEDNSGRANIFGVEVRAAACLWPLCRGVLLMDAPALVQPRTLYTQSPTADRAARQGLGGQQGLLVLAACLAAVAVALLGVGRDAPQTLSQVEHLLISPGAMHAQVGRPDPWRLVCCAGVRSSRGQAVAVFAGGRHAAVDRKEWRFFTEFRCATCKAFLTMTKFDGGATPSIRPRSCSPFPCIPATMQRMSPIANCLRKTMAYLSYRIACSIPCARTPEPYMCTLTATSS